MNITIDSKAFKMIMDKLDFVETSVKVLSHRASTSKWMSEDEVKALTDLSTDTLYRKRKEGKLRYSTVSGRKIKYLRTDVEAYLNGTK